VARAERGGRGALALLEGRFASCESKKGALGLSSGHLGCLGVGAALATPVGLMSRLAILSDVHADVYALRDALLRIERLGCDAVVCAGDLVDYGPFPEETLALLMECNIPTIRGNHDRCAMLESRADRTWSPSKRAITFLRRLPIAWSARIDGVRVAVHHARPGSDLNGIEPDVTEAAAGRPSRGRRMRRARRWPHAPGLRASSRGRGLGVQPGPAPAGFAGPTGDTRGRDVRGAGGSVVRVPRVLRGYGPGRTPSLWRREGVKRSGGP
jgi:3',5'-cyclic AMP phosphodiesterase CpdA